MIALLSPQLAAFVGAMFVAYGGGEWYASLDKPFFSPPPWIFRQVWTILYILMGIASYLVWRQSTSPWYSRTMTWYWMQLWLNGLWTPVFFGLHSPLLGIIVILPLTLLVAICVYAFWLRSRIASFIMVPYLIWICYASVLNIAVFWLNR